MITLATTFEQSLASSVRRREYAGVWGSPPCKALMHQLARRLGRAVCRLWPFGAGRPGWHRGRALARSAALDLSLEHFGKTGFWI